MRSTVFIGFGAVLILLLIWIIFTNVSAKNDPVMRAARKFFTAVATQDATACAGTIDLKAVKITKVGNKITTVGFADMHGQGALSTFAGNVWNYNDLSKLTLDEMTSPDVADGPGLATVCLSDDYKMFLRRSKNGETWKVIYITAPKIPKRR